MYHQIEIVEVSSFAHSIKTFMLGAVVAFIISIIISYNPVPSIMLVSSSFDCNNQAALVRAQDRSRNGIANGCSNQFKI
jgi:hypothetical protein